MAWMRIGILALTAVAIVGCSSGDSNKKAVMNNPVDGMGEPVDKDMFKHDLMPHTHMAAGQLHESKRLYARAAEQYRLAIGLDPKLVEAYNRLGIVLDKINRFREADIAFDKAIELAPDQSHLYNNRGFSRVMQGRWAAAELDFLKAIELKPTFARARVNLGMALAQQDRFEEAFKHFSVALKKPNAYYNIGLMYQSRHKDVEAAGAFKTALELKPDMVAARKRLDLLPAEAVSAAEPMRMAVASPSAGQAPAVAVQSTALVSPAPSTQPAVDQSAIAAGGSTPATPIVPSDATVEPEPKAQLSTAIEAEPIETPAVKDEVESIEIVAEESIVQPEPVLVIDPKLAETPEAVTVPEAAEEDLTEAEPVAKSDNSESAPAPEVIASPSPIEVVEPAAASKSDQAAATKVEAAAARLQFERGPRKFEIDQSFVPETASPGPIAPVITENPFAPRSPWQGLSKPADEPCWQLFTNEGAPLDTLSSEDETHPMPLALADAI